MDWSLASPLALLLLPLPLLALRLLPPAPGGSGALQVPGGLGARLEGRSEGSFDPVETGRRLLPAVLWVCLVIALAGPRTLAPASALPTSGRDLVLVLDMSGSMERTDFELDGRTVSRLEAVKAVAVAFVRGRSGDRVGLVAFAEDAYFAAPPTHDVGAVAHAVRALTIGIAGRTTAISDGLGLALKRLEGSSAASRVVILLSDGVDTAGAVEPVDAAGLAQELGVRVHTIALGPLASDEPGAGGDAVDAATLRAVAAASGGTAFRVRTTADLETVAQAIDALETSRQSVPAVQAYRDLWVFPAGLAFALAVVLLLLRARRP